MVALKTLIFTILAPVAPVGRGGLEGPEVDRLKEIVDYATSPVATDLLSATPGKRSIT